MSHNLWAQITHLFSEFNARTTISLKKIKVFIIFSTTLVFLFLFCFSPSALKSLSSLVSYWPLLLSRNSSNFINYIWPHSLFVKCSPQSKHRPKLSHSSQKIWLLISPYHKNLKITMFKITISHQIISPSLNLPPMGKITILPCLFNCA